MLNLETIRVSGTLHVFSKNWAVKRITAPWRKPEGIRLCLFHARASLRMARRLKARHSVRVPQQSIYEFTRNQ